MSAVRPPMKPAGMRVSSFIMPVRLSLTDEGMEWWQWWRKQTACRGCQRHAAYDSQPVCGLRTSRCATANTHTHTHTRARALHSSLDAHAEEL
jgi:hypothetical protein